MSSCAHPIFRVQNHWKNCKPIGWEITSTWLDGINIKLIGWKKKEVKWERNAILNLEIVNIAWFHYQLYYFTILSQDIKEVFLERPGNGGFGLLIARDKTLPPPALFIREVTPGGIAANTGLVNKGQWHTPHSGIFDILIPVWTTQTITS